MNTFPTITIPDPAAVGKWLDEELGTSDRYSNPSFDPQHGWMHVHWFAPNKYVSATGETPEALLADIRRQLAENDPLAKLRKEWIAAGRPQLD